MNIILQRCTKSIPVWFSQTPGKTCSNNKNLIIWVWDKNKSAKPHSCFIFATLYHPTWEKRISRPIPMHHLYCNLYCIWRLWRQRPPVPSFSAKGCDWFSQQRCHFPWIWLAIVPQYSWMVYVMEHPIKIADFGVPQFRTPPCGETDKHHKFEPVRFFDR